MPEENGPGLYGVVRIKGSVKTRREIEDTLEKLKLGKVNNCTIVPADGTYKGMLRKADEYVTWGEIREETLAKMLEKRGRSRTGAKLDPKKAKELAAKVFKERTLKSADISPVFRLSPPSGGMRSVKIRHPRGDAGYRGEEINGFLERMI